MSVIAAPPLTTAAQPKFVRPISTLWGDAVWRYSRNRLAVGALVVVGLFIAMAVFADLISPARYDFSALAEANQFPSTRHLLGTDAVGRDFLSRLIYGARVSLTEIGRASVGKECRS